LNFQEYFKEKFSKTGLSAAEFCIRAKISKPLFYFYMQGKRVPSPETMPKLAETLGVQVDEFKHLGRASMGRPKITKPSEEYVLGVGMPITEGDYSPKIREILKSNSEALEEMLNERK